MCPLLYNIKQLMIHKWISVRDTVTPEVVTPFGGVTPWPLTDFILCTSICNFSTLALMVWTSRRRSSISGIEITRNNLTPALLCNHKPSKVWGGITYQFLIFIGSAVEVCNWYLSMLSSKLTSVKAVPALQWLDNEFDGVSNHQPHNRLLNRLFRHRSKKTSKLRVTGLCEGNSPATSEFPALRAINAENVSIWWRHHVDVHRWEIFYHTIPCFSLELDPIL